MLFFVKIKRNTEFKEIIVLLQIDSTILLWNELQVATGSHFPQISKPKQTRR